jgi:8-oxo-dGTP pyrophosphatase MutT (NUDIX family)
MGRVTGLIQVVGGAVVDRLAEPSMLLVARRSAPEKLAGLWEFPGGKVEPGEEPEVALCRELVEELGIGVRLGAELPAEAPSGWRLNDRASMRVWFAEIRRANRSPSRTTTNFGGCRWLTRMKFLACPGFLPTSRSSTSYWQRSVCPQRARALKTASPE